MNVIRHIRRLAPLIALPTLVLAAGEQRIELEHAETLTFDRKNKGECQVLRGNVRFRHEGATLHCDSAYFYSKENSMDAFGNVRMVQGDTLFLYSRTLHYDGDRRLASAHDDVRLVNQNTTLETDRLDYDRQASIAYYLTGGKIFDDTNTLTSLRGYYYANSHQSEFKGDVLLTGTDFRLTSDTLKYNTQSKEAVILGPSDISYKDDEAHIYSENGLYNTAGQTATLYNRSVVTGKDGRSATADTLFYDRISGDCLARRRAVINDTTQKMMLTGHFGRANSLRNTAFMTDSATAVSYADKDSLFLHADTIAYWKDSIYNNLKAFHGVRFFHPQVQGKCDSLAYNSRDSLATMFFEPVIWNDQNQLTGTLMQMKIENGAVSRLFVHQTGMLAMQDDSTRYNQLYGREITGIVRDNKLSEILVSGNAQSIYFPREQDSTVVGVNRTESANIKIYFADGKMDRALLYPSPTGRMLQEEGLAHEDKFFPQFQWLSHLRPASRHDIYRRTEPVARPDDEKRQGRRRKD